VLFIGFFYTMPQMKGAGTTLAYIFPGLPYWVGVVLVGAVITLNVALGGMKGITLVQAFQYWIKMFAISVPIFVLMAVYGFYNNHLKAKRHRPADGHATAPPVAGRPVSDPGHALSASRSRESPADTPGSRPSAR
jgi:cation/acetate symporter